MQQYKLSIFYVNGNYSHTQKGNSFAQDLLIPPYLSRYNSPFPWTIPLS